MPAGMRIWDGSGNLTVEYTDGSALILGQFSISGSAGSTTVSQWSSGTPFAFFLINGFNTYSGVPLTISGTTLSWASGWTGLVIYGVQ